MGSFGLAFVLSVLPGPALALGPTATDWVDVTVSKDVSSTVHLNAVHGRSRPNSSDCTQFSPAVKDDVWAVGDGGEIWHYNGTNWIAYAGSPTTADLNAVYINPDGTGWAAGDGGTILRLTGGTWSCYTCPTDLTGCGGAGQPPAAACTGADLYSIFVAAPKATVTTSLYITGDTVCNPPNGAFGDKPTMLYWDGATMKLLTGATSPSVNPLGGYACPGGNTINYTGISISATTAATFISQVGGGGDRRAHMVLKNDSWQTIGAYTSYTACSGSPYPRVFASTMIGSLAIAFGDTDCGPYTDRLSNPGVVTNVFYFDNTPGSEKLRAVQTGLGTATTDRGTIRAVDFLSFWGFGIGVGWGDAGVGANWSTVDTSGTDAYFARLTYPDPSNPYPVSDDPASPNSIIYEANSAMRRLNGVFIATSNEAWTVGDDGKIYRWQVTSQAPALAIRFTTSPTLAGNPAAGQVIEVIMTVTNSGGRPVRDVTASVPWSSDVAYAAAIPPGVAASFTWSYTVTSCIAGLTLSGSATGTDVDTCGTVSASGSALLVPPPSITISLAQIPVSGSVSYGQVVTYRIVVANLSAATLDALTVTDSIDAILDNGVASSQPPGWPAATNAGAPNPRAYGWNSPGPVAPGAVLTFTLTGSVGFACNSVMFDRAYFRATLACLPSGSLLQDISPPTGSLPLQLTASGPPMAVTINAPSYSPGCLPGCVQPGQAVNYTLSMQNTGAATIDSIIVRDTLPAGLVYSSSSQPGGWPAATVTALPGGATHVEWSRVSVANLMTPGQTLFFSVNSVVGNVCSSIDMQNDIWAKAWDVCNPAGVQGMNTNTLVVTIPPNALATSLTLTGWTSGNPLGPQPGDCVTYRIVVANTGSSTINALTVADTLPWVVTPDSALCPPTSEQPAAFPPVAAAPAGVAGASVYVWSQTGLTFLPGTDLTFTLTGRVAGACAAGLVAHVAGAKGSYVTNCDAFSAAPPVSFGLPGGLPPPLRVTIARSPTVPAPRTPVTYTFTVSNTGSVTADDLVLIADLPPDVTPGATQFDVAGFTNVSAPLAGGGRRFTWTGLNIALTGGLTRVFQLSGTMTASCNARTVAVPATATGTNAVCGTSGATTSTDSHAQPAPLAAALSVKGVREVEGRYYMTLILTVSNTGVTTPPMSASLFIPASSLSLSSSSSTAEVVPLDGPSPTEFADSLIPVPCFALNRCATSFTWHFRSTAIVPVTYTANLTALTFTNTWTGSLLCAVTASASTQFTDVGEEGTYVLDRNLIRSRIESVNISFNVRESGPVSLEVYNAVGQRVRTLYRQDAVRRQPYNPNTVPCTPPAPCLNWDGTNDLGERVASGAYFLRLVSERYVSVRKLAVVK